MRFLLLQVRNQDDPMRLHEVEVFARSIGCSTEAITVLDCLSEPITPERFHGYTMALIGGSGNYSACGHEPWLLRTLDGLRMIYERHLRLFASCWGFQALARALGGKVVNDRQRAEVGTHHLYLTEAGKRDPLFGYLPIPFSAQMGHEDHVVELPPGAVRLASSKSVENQAYTFADRPIYATQFHPELHAADLFLRIRQYPDYLMLITGLTFERFEQQIHDTPECAQLIRRLIKLWADDQVPAAEQTDGRD
jgi:GMP synthase (glutamine-hydrolysing)